MYRKIVKPVLDISLALLLFPFLIIITIFVAILIKIDDKGSVFFISKRVGQNGKLFSMFKFRTMKVNSDDIRLEDGSTFSSEKDDRVTKIGSFLRKTSIDELPQILNILKGDMSFIGPRPDPVDWLNRYPQEYLEFLKCKPGITGYNQAYHRNSNNGLDKMKNDLLYAKKISLCLDLKIFFKTIDVVLKKDNLYKQ